MSCQESMLINSSAEPAKKKMREMEMSFQTLMSCLLENEVTALALAKVMILLEEKLEDQKVLSVWEDIKHYMKLYVNYHLQQNNSTDRQNIVIPAYELDLDFTAICPETELFTMSCRSSIAERLLLLWKDVQKDVLKTDLSSSVTIERGNSDICTSFMNVYSQVDNVGVHSSEISDFHDVLSDLYGLEPKRSSLLQRICYTRNNKSYISNLETFAGHRVIEIKVASFADVLRLPEDMEWKAFETKVLFVTENDQDPLDREITSLTAAIQRVGKNPKCLNATKKLPY